MGETPMLQNLNSMFWAGHSEEVNRPEHKAINITTIERQLDLLITIAPCSIFSLHLEASEIGCA